MFTIIHLLVILVGMVVISKYRYCDPIKTKRIMTADQLFPLFVMDTMGSIPVRGEIFFFSKEKLFEQRYLGHSRNFRRRNLLSLSVNGIVWNQFSYSRCA